MSLLCCLSSFCSENNSCESIFNEFLKLKKLDSNQRCTLLERLSNLLKDSRYTTKIADHFRHILLILLTSAIPIYDGSICTLQLLECNHQTNCVILGKLIGSYPDVLGFTLHYFEKLPAPFRYIEGNATAQINQVNEPMDTDPITDYDIVSATYNILKANPHHFKRKWNWSECYSFLTHSDDKVKWVGQFNLLVGQSKLRPKLLINLIV